MLLRLVKADCLLTTCDYVRIKKARTTVEGCWLFVYGKDVKTALVTYEAVGQCWLSGTVEGC